jgi:hypothetical protein
MNMDGNLPIERCNPGWHDFILCTAPDNSSLRAVATGGVSATSITPTNQSNPGSVIVPLSF